MDGALAAYPVLQSSASKTFAMDATVAKAFNDMLAA
jgi:hypothetical protein